MNRDIEAIQFNLGKVISTGWRLFWENIRSILFIFLIVYIPINFALSFVPIDYLIETHGLRAFRMYMRIVELSEFLIGVLAVMSLAELIEASVLGTPVTWQQAFQHALSRWWASIGTGLLAGLIVIGMTLLLIVPGIIWGLYYSFVVFVVALRGLSGKDALDYSKQIVKGQWWRVLGYLLVIELLGVVTCVILAVPFFFTPELRILEIISSTLIDIAGALFLCMTIVFFLNNDFLKQRRDRLDKEVE
jgi:hypothetical protein